eukprot:1439893-Rhodomonas_salina.2
MPVAHTVVPYAIISTGHRVAHRVAVYAMPVPDVAYGARRQLPGPPCPCAASHRQPSCASPRSTAALCSWYNDAVPRQYNRQLHAR